MLRHFLQLAAAFAAVSVLPVRAADASEVTQRLALASTAFSEVTAAEDKGIPRDLLEKANCVAIVPGLKQGAFIVGAKYGKGFLMCRKGPGQWSAPASIRVEGGSFGFQVGGSSTDLVLVVLSQKGADRLMSSEFTFGGAGEVAAGPIGRSATAKTDPNFSADILSWSRSRGVFAGLSLEGSTLREDTDDNQALYGKPLSTREIVRGTTGAPPAASALLKQLAAFSPHEN